jgi:hypothetical protein
MAGIVPDPMQKTGNVSPFEGSQDSADIGREAAQERKMRLPQRSKGLKSAK